MTTNYVSLKSVLFQLSTLIDDRYYNETVALEWAAQGLQKANVIPKLEDKIYITKVTDHKATLPSDFHYLVQIAYQQEALPISPFYYVPNEAHMPNIFGQYFTNLIPVSGITGVRWVPLRLATSVASVDKRLLYCDKCTHTFTVSSNGVITTSIDEACLMIQYKAYPTDDNGDLLIPDNQDLKEALLHYVLYNYWLTKYMMKEEGAESRVNFHLTRYNTLSKKAQNLNLPDPAQYENLMGVWRRMFTPTSHADNLYTTLGNRENANF